MAGNQRNDMRRVGSVLLLGVVAGFGARYVMSKVAPPPPPRPLDDIDPAEYADRQMIDWQQARKIATRVSQWEQAPVTDRLGRRSQYTRMVEQSVPLISDYMGVSLPKPITRLYVVDRRDWLIANFESFERIFQPVEDLYRKLAARQQGAGGVLGQINSKLLGAQMGALVGFLARRVLGQYDLSLFSPDSDSQGVLYFVEPNIARVQEKLGLSDEDFRLWIALHETTHVFQFEAFPWVRPYFNELLGQFLGTATDQLANASTSVTQLAGRLLGGRGNGSHWIEHVMSAEQRATFDRMQALMSVVEGYSNHIMNAIGEQLLPSFHDIERRISDRQQNRPLFEELFNRITGMDLKLAQYQQGEQFINAVVARRGVAFANRVWTSAEHLPTLAEIRDPEAWIARIDQRND